MRYGFDNFMSRGGLSVFLALLALFVASIAVLTGLRFLVNLVFPQSDMADLTDQAWRSFLQVADGGAVAEDSASNPAHRVVGIVALFAGLVLFSSLVAFITSQFEQMMSRLRKGRSRVLESGHTLMLGFSERSVEIIKELVEANASESRASVVVLAEREKDELDDYFNEHLPVRGTTRLVTRSGSVSRMQTLERVAVERARSVVILSDARPDAPEDEKALADARVLKSLMAVVACTGEEGLPPVVAELHLAGNRNLAKGISDRVSTMDEVSLLAKLIVQTSRVSGLALVYDNLVGFDGCEFYLWEPRGGFTGQTVDQASFSLATASLIGHRSAEGTLTLNPPRDMEFRPGDMAVVIAEDDSTITWKPAPVPALQEGMAPRGGLQKTAERQLLVGWGRLSAPLMAEYAEYLESGSSLDVVLPPPGPDGDQEKAVAELSARFPELHISFRMADVRDPAGLAELQPEAYHNVIILASAEGDAELKDARTIATLLSFRNHFRALGRKDFGTQLITEVADSDNTDIIQETGVRDFLISNRFVSRIFAQVSQDPVALEIYDDLFREEGSEVYLKDAGLYLTPGSWTFARICRAAMERKETCLGLRLAALADDPAEGWGIRINPDKDQVFVLGPGDQLVTLAEDET